MRGSPHGSLPPGTLINLSLQSWRTHKRMKKARLILSTYYTHNPPSWYTNKDMEEIEHMDAPVLFDCIVQDHEFMLEIEEHECTDFGVCGRGRGGRGQMRGRRAFTLADRGAID